MNYSEEDTETTQEDSGQEEIRTAHPNGHFYSPVVDPRELAEQMDRIWPPAAPATLGLNFNDESHQAILKDWFPRHIRQFDYPEHPVDGAPGKQQFYVQNSQFSWLDARTLFVFLKELMPKKVLEVGSGYSSLLMADVNRRFLGMGAEIICVEPYPREFLVDGVEGISGLIQEKVQETSIDPFLSLGRGDILFIDSSHVCKTGSDVNYLFFQVLPMLSSGVLVHIHDVFLPFEYPKEWVLEENRSWNEQYVLRALLMYSNKFRIVFGCNYAFHKFGEAVVKALDLSSGAGFGGGSLWLEVQ